MARRPEPFPHDEIVNELAATFKQAQLAILRQIQAADRIGNLQYARERRLQLAAVLAALDQMGAATEPAARRAVRDAFDEGSATVLQGIGAQVGTRPVVPEAFAGVRREAIEALQRSVTDRLGASRQMVGRRVEDFYAKAGRRAAARALLGADGSPQSAARWLEKELLNDPLTRSYGKATFRSSTGRKVQKLIGFVDSADKKWAIDTYSEMVVRTTTRQAVVEGQVIQMAANGINLARISSHASACQICRPFEGRLVSLDGSMTSFQGQSVADTSIGLPPYHPNCRHTIEPVVVEIEQLRQEMGVISA